MPQPKDNLDTTQTITIAGSTGALGKKLARECVAIGVVPKAIVRPSSNAKDVAKLREIGAEIVEVNTEDVDAMAKVMAGADCVVSCLAGLRPVIIDAQAKVLKAAEQAGVKRFIPSDFAEDFYKVDDGRNRNLDLRREFAKTYLEDTPLQVTSILNGVFNEFIFMAPYVMPKIGRSLYFGSREQKLDATAMDDAARYTAHAALDPDAPRFLRIAGNVVTIDGMAEHASKAYGKTFKPLYGGPIAVLRGMIAAGKVFDNGKELYPAYQGMQYMENMLSGDGKLKPLDNDRYGQWEWTPISRTLADGKPDFIG